MPRFNSNRRRKCAANVFKGLKRRKLTATEFVCDFKVSNHLSF